MESYYIIINLLKFLTLNSKINPKLSPRDFGLKDFGFIFRARGYSYFFSKRIANDGFNNTVIRLNKILLKEYIETFIERLDSSEMDVDLKPVALKELSEEKRYVINMLTNGNSKEKLEAIKLIIDNNILEALDNLEYLLGSNSDEKVMNSAFDAIMVLKNLE